MDELSRLLRSVDQVDPPDLWPPHRARVAGRAARRGRATAALIGILAFGLVVASALILRSPQRPPGQGVAVTPTNIVPTSPMPSVGSVINLSCTGAGAVAATPEVTLDSDGVRIEVDNSVASEFLSIQPRPEQLGWRVEIQAGRHLISDSFALEPGPVTLLCFGGPSSVDSPAVVMVSDPEGYWPALQDLLTCGEEEPPPASSDGTGALAQVPAGTLLLMSYDAASRGDIYTMPADGTRLIPVLTGPADDQSPIFSPDGQRIAFSSDRQGGGIFVANVDGSGIMRVGTSGTVVDWAPDGTKLLFNRSAAAGRSLFVMDTDGSHEKPVTSVESDRASWSPDGSTIAFVGQEGLPDGSGPAIVGATPCPHSDILAVPSQGGTPVHLTDDDSVEQSPQWSPDGSRIAYMKNVGPGDHRDVYVMDADGGNVQRLTDHLGYDGGAVWSPDGTMLAFSSDRGSPTPGDAHAQLFVMNSDGSGVTRLGDVTVTSTYLYDWKPQKVGGDER